MEIFGNIWKYSESVVTNAPTGGFFTNRSDLDRRAIRIVKILDLFKADVSQMEHGSENPEDGVLFFASESQNVHRPQKRSEILPIKFRLDFARATCHIS